MGDAHRERYANDAVALGARLAGAVSPKGAIDDDAVWEVYAGVEKLIAVIRFRLDYETPGSFAKLPDAKVPLRLLDRARSLIPRSAEEIRTGSLVRAVETLRLARNDLRGYLRSRRLAARRRGLT